MAQKLVLEDLLREDTEESEEIDGFHAFLRFELIEETLRFLRAVHAYELLQKEEERRDKAAHMLELFFSSASPLEINVGAIKVDVQKKASNAEVTLFRAASDSIMNDLRMDAFPRYLRSVFHKQIEEKKSVFPNELFQEFVWMVDGFSEEWVEQPPADDVLRWIKRYKKSSAHAFKSRILIKASPEDILAVVGKPEDITLYDPNINHVEVLNRFSDTFCIYYAVGRSNMMFVSDRDFVLARIVHRTPDGSIMVVSRSVDYDQQFAEVKGCVRGDLEATGWLMRPLGPELTELIYLNQVNYAGWIPVSAANSTAKNRTATICQAVRKLVGTRLKELAEIL